MIDPATIGAIISVATRVIEAGNRAINAANNGDIEAAKKYLEGVDNRVDTAVAAYKAAEPPQ